LRTDNDHFAGRGLDAIDGVVAKIAKLPHNSLDAIQVVSLAWRLRQGYFFRPDGEAHALTEAEAPLILD
jgi:hypothetical protein